MIKKNPQGDRTTDMGSHIVLGAKLSSFIEMYHILLCVCQVCKRIEWMSLFSFGGQRQYRGGIQVKFFFIRLPSP